MTRIAINGAAGRMGRRIAALAIESERFDIVSALEMPGHEAMGRDIGELAGVGAFGVALSEKLTGSPEVVIDFSLPEGTAAALETCLDRGIAMVIGTTGLTESQLAAVADAAATLRIVHASNYSLGINLLSKLAALAARTLGEGYDVEIGRASCRERV